MPDRIFYPLALICAAALIALAAVYPQGTGARSPKPFGHETTAEAAARRQKLHPKPEPAPKSDLRGPL